MNPKRFHIITMGCQMNMYDSEQIERLLVTMNYLPAARQENADVVLLNTCSIRQKPEHKVWSHLGRLARLKRKRPDLIIGVGGCLAQQEGRRIMKRASHVDIVFGTSAIDRLPALIKEVVDNKTQVVDVAGKSTAEPPEIKPSKVHEPRASAFVTIMSGCENFCTYCVVPYVRGREVSRQPQQILKEIQYLVETGVREVTLLGQNVNSYGVKGGHGCDFPGLLAAINANKGLKRIRFTTSHPKDLSDKLVTAFADLERLAPHIHLPVQSGSDHVLKRMNRGYTTARYLNRVEALRKARPDIGITTDIIVGFPGEQRGDFEQTLDLLRSVQFDNIYAFKYSDRPDVPASRFSNKVDDSEKQERLAELLEVQSDITLKKNRLLVGTVQEVLVEGFSKKGGGQLTGHTPCNKIVNFPEVTVRIGEIMPVWITGACSHSLLGEIRDCCGERSRAKGGILHAA